MTLEQPDVGSPQLFAHLTDERGVLMVRLVGPQLGEREGGIVTQMIQTRLTDAAAGPIGVVVLDFADISFMNSSGLGSCVNIRNAALAAGGSVVLYRMSQQIESVFRMTKLHRIFKIAGDEKTLGKLTR